MTSETTTVVVVGALARVEQSRRGDVEAALGALAGTSTFDVNDPERLGILIEADSIDCAHDRLVGDVRATPGVLGVWPVSMEWDADERGPSD